MSSPMRIHILVFVTDVQMPVQELETVDLPTVISEPTCSMADYADLPDVADKACSSN